MTWRWFMAGSVIVLMAAGCGTASPSGLANQSVILGSTHQSVTVALPVSQGRVWWRVGSRRWQQSPVEVPPATMPTPLRQTLAWAQELAAGQWPGTPLPNDWAAWAGHVGSPRGWLVTNVPANGGPAHPVAIDVFLPEKAPYHGYGVLSVFWTEQRGHWLATVRNPEALPATTNLHTLWKRAQ